jgi:hypothetical protein
MLKVKLKSGEVKEFDSPMAHKIEQRELGKIVKDSNEKKKPAAKRSTKENKEVKQRKTK